ncbi:uncharacterized protein LOC128890137 [Hylaeus anthracinus]|uniref:uncharacterized protein LOC128875000 n=1 Tax=Hylaeus volcanicus TaxID=313075 RepID=UPI0023B7F40C|nr:uncharacterized protein LOC128875000 [Hylaeus volcanicus]XP_054004351.1 uncharacterized protein LOC128890137 [Hylaeus anthracinus]
MDPRCNKPRDFVAATKNLTEGIQKQRHLQMKWFQTYEWLLDEQQKLKKELEELCKEKETVIKTETFVREEGKTCLPFPVTTSAEYGWLASKPKFKLEKYGSYMPEYPDPLRDIVPLSGNIPVLAAGKGYIW